MADQKRYFMDSDNELRRLRINHALFMDAMGKLVFAPLDTSRGSLDVLDSATADGQWLRDFASGYPSTKLTLTGTDINQHYFPTDHASNEHYIVQDMTASLPPEWHGRFDFVHQRLGLLGAGATMEKFIANLATLVKPGGWLQIVELSNRHVSSDGPGMQDFVNLLNAVFVKSGASVEYDANIADWMSKAGLSNIKQEVIHCHMGKTSVRPDLCEPTVDSTAIAVGGLAGFAKTWPEWPENMAPVDLDTAQERISAELRAQGGTMLMRVVWGQKLS